MADRVSDLPTNNNYTHTPHELQILQKYFENPEESSKLISELKPALIAGVVFVLLSNPATSFLLDYVPHMGSPLIRTVGLFMIFVIVFYVALLIFKK